ncbi:hydroxylase [Microbacterium atlanticum]|uniref:hydroxylase n=1 Tax=Microbacterium atlanticum TaxID=2782168 RepID=UPI001888A83D|nr:hydroxylase [Microbacterium atlanticum]
MSNEVLDIATHAPTPTADELVARVRALQPLLRELQPEHARIGTYSAPVHEAFLEAQLYDILRPRRFGGLQLGLRTFYSVVREIAVADPGASWAFSAATSSQYDVGSYFPLAAQEAAFSASPFIAASRVAPPESSVERADGGFRISGKWNFCSGSTWGSHFLAGTFATQEDGSRTPYLFLVPREDYTVLDDWGQDAALGMHASASNTVAIDNAFVPDELAVVRDFGTGESTPGFEIHGDALYLGRTYTTYAGGFAATQVGAAQAALAEYERLLARGASIPPRGPRNQSFFYQRWYGELMSMTDSAAALLDSALAELERRKVDWAEGRGVFTKADDARLRGQVVQATLLAGKVIDQAFVTGGTSSTALAGATLGRLQQDALMYRTHIGAQWDVLHTDAGRLNLGLDPLG